MDSTAIQATISDDILHKSDTINSPIEKKTDMDKHKYRTYYIDFIIVKKEMNREAMVWV